MLMQSILHFYTRDPSLDGCLYVCNFLALILLGFQEHCKFYLMRTVCDAVENAEVCASVCACERERKRV